MTRVRYEAGPSPTPPRYRKAPERLPGAPTFDPDHFYGVAGDLVRTITPWTEADPVTLYASIVTTAGVLISPSYFGRVGSMEHPPRLFMCTFGGTSIARKGTALAENRMIFEAALPSEPTRSYMKGGTNTAEGLMDRFNSLPTSPKRILAVESEFGRVLTLSGREGNVLSFVVRDLWDESFAENNTRKTPIDIPDANLGLLVNITKEELNAKLDQVDVFNGMANRFLWVYSQRERLISDPVRVPESVIEDLANILGERIHQARAVGFVERNRPASKRWDRLYIHRANGRVLPPRIAAVTQRADAQQLRLQLIFAALDGSPVIASSHVIAAERFWSYCEASAAYLFSSSTGNPQLDKVLAALRIADGNELPRSVIRTSVLKDNIDTPGMESLLSLGEGFGLSSSDGKPSGKVGRPAQMWHLAS